MTLATEIYAIWRNKTKGGVNELMEMIDAAIQEARNEALEEAASIVTNTKGNRLDMLHAIRALKVGE